MISGKEEYLKRKYALDQRYGINYCHHKPKKFSPYKGFDKDAVLKRDNFICQWCGYTPTKKEVSSTTINNLIELHHRYILCDWIKSRVRICPFNGSQVSVDCYCEEHCRKDDLNLYINCHKQINLERISNNDYQAYAWLKLNAHHLDEDKTNNDLSNLVTLCHSCHMLYHARRKKGYTIEKAQLEVKKLKELKE